MEISYSELYKIIRDNNFVEYGEVKNYIVNNYNVEILDGEPIRRYFKVFKDKWKISQRNATRFEEKQGSWLNLTMKLKTKDVPSTCEHTISKCEQQQPTTSTSISRGRPTKSLEECSDISKRRKLRDHNEDLSTSLVNQSLCQRYKCEKLHQKALIVEAVDKASPKRVKRIKDSISTPQDQPRKFTPEEALSLFLDLGLSKEKYIVLRNELKKRKHDALPSYNKIIAAKKECLPVMEEVTNISVSVSLQKLLDSTAGRILHLKTEHEIEAMSDTSVVLESKWGCDGSSGQSEYKQRINEDNCEIVTDANMFITSMVPLRLKCRETDNLVWKNPRPSSAHFCRPIKFQYLKETKELIKSEVEAIKSQINSLVPTKCLVHGKEIEVIHKLYLTMVDGKVTQYLTDTKSSSACIICQKNPKDFRNTEEEPNIVENYQYGLSPLHARIRFMEFILHLSYDLSFTNEGIRNNPENKQKRQEEKSRIQREFRSRLGLIIDTPKQGFGNTNDGNTARRFFEYPDITSEITRVDLHIIKKMKTILNVLSCGLPVNAEKFGTYAEETEKLLTQIYPWRKLTATVHKILKHGKDILLHHLLPIGELSEEAQEAKNKDYKYYRYHNTRKISRKEQNQDLMNMLLLSSDPYISSFRRVRTKRDVSKAYPQEMADLLDTDIDNIDMDLEEN